MIEKNIPIDICSELLRNRIILLYGEINNQSAKKIISELLWLYHQNSEEEITIYLNSPGGNVSDGFDIIDTIQLLSCPVNIICTGLCASMGALILSVGTKRIAYPHSEIMIHQPLSEFNGKASDIEIATAHLLQVKDKIVQLLSQQTGQSIHKIKSDIEKDYYLSPEEALAYHLIDEIRYIGGNE